jgi:hypothetical protein
MPCSHVSTILGAVPSFREAKRVKSFPYARRACFHGSQGIAPLAPTFVRRACVRPGRFRGFATRGQSGLPGATRSHHHVPRHLWALAHDADAARSGFAYAGARRLCSSLHPLPTLSNRGSAVPTFTLLCLQFPWTVTAGLLLGGITQPPRPRTRRATFAAAGANVCLPRVGGAGLGWLGPWVHYAPGV